MVIAFFRKHFILTVFFLFLSIYLFLGDGQQMLVDTVGAAGTLILVCVAYLYGKKKREFPVVFSVLWGIYLLYAVFRTVFSDDIGYSVYATIRMIDAFLVCYIFYCYSTPEDRDVFPKYVLGFSLFSLFIAVVYTLTPFLRSTLPNTNLLVPSYGHNHVVDILLFGIPVACFGALQKKNTQWYAIALVCLLGGVVFSFARAAMLLVGVFVFVSILWLWKKISFKQKVIWSAVCIGLSLLFSIFFIAPQSLYQKYVHTAVVPRMEKKSIGADGRLEYFRQAIMAIKERPIVGSGPGTFILQSKRLQDAPDFYSRYAHNFLLEEWSNGGMIGVIVFSFLLCWCMWQIVVSIRSMEHQKRLFFMSLLLSCLVSLFYACLDFTMSFFVVSTLFWSTIGILLADGKKYNGQSSVSHYVSGMALVVITVFYGLQFFCFSGFLKKGDVFSYVYYLGEGRTLEYIQKHNEIEDHLASIFLLLHKKNPSVLFAMCTMEHVPLASSVCSHALVLDKHNKKSIDDMLKAAFHYKHWELLGEIVAQIKPAGISLDFTDEKIKDIYAKIPDIFIGSIYGDNTNIFFSKLLYFIGVETLPLHPDITYVAWEKAYELNPHWSYFILELAALYMNRGETEKVRQLFLLCEKDVYAQKDCSLYRNEPYALGAFYLDILAIPTP